MCRVTASDTSPPPSTGRLRKRNSFSSTASTSSSSTSLRSSSSSSKRVSFSDKIKVYPFERLQNDQLAEVFYTTEDYRRFRSDSCLELLDQQVSPDRAFVVVCKKFFGAIVQKSRQRNQKKQQQQTIDYPWLEPYHPHEDSSAPQQQQAPPALAAPRSKEDTTLERRLIEELAFLRT